MPYAYIYWTFNWSVFFFGKILRAMENTLFLVCYENPKVTEGLTNLHKGSKAIRDQACQMTSVIISLQQ